VKIHPNLTRSHIQKKKNRDPTKIINNVTQSGGLRYPKLSNQNQINQNSKNIYSSKAKKSEELPNSLSMPT
jgi:hypothetical protein